MNYLVLALCTSLIVLSKADNPIPHGDFEEILYDSDEASRNDNLNYRLPTSVIPLKYDIYLDLYFDERTDNPFSYDGREDITIKTVEEVAQIVLHANVDAINDVTLRTIDDVELDIDNYVTEMQYHFLKINLNRTLVANETYILHIDYSSTMNDGPMKRGIWKGWYRDDNNVERIYATTHFQPYNARQAFPCWDEPLYKAEFQLHLSRPNNYNNTFSNTANNGTTERYIQTYNTLRRL